MTGLQEAGNGRLLVFDPEPTGTGNNLKKEFYTAVAADSVTWTAFWLCSAHTQRRWAGLVIAQGAGCSDSLAAVSAVSADGGEHSSQAATAYHLFIQG